MPNQSSSGVQWSDLAPDAAATTTLLTLRRRRAGVYELTSQRIGPVAGSLVSDGAGGWVITVGDFTGTGLVLKVGSAFIIR